MLDVHCHILPGADHGADTMKTSCAMLKNARAAGITAVVATPHVYKPDADTARMRLAYERLLPCAEREGLTLLMGYECNLFAVQPDDVAAAARFCIEGTDLLLLEMPPDVWPPNYERILYKLQAAGLRLIIAHPERYGPVQRSIDVARRMSELDCLLQVTASAVLPGLASPEKRTARKLIEQDLVQFVASDAHDAQGYGAFPRAVQRMMRRQGSDFRTAYGVTGLN